MQGLSGGSVNVAVGYASMIYASETHLEMLPSVEEVEPNSLRKKNVALGKNSMYVTTTGEANTAIGYGTLFSNTTGSHNVALGVVSLSENTTGTRNAASGSMALQRNTTGSSNSASGTEALNSNTIGNAITAVGSDLSGIDHFGPSSKLKIHVSTNPCWTPFSIRFEGF